MNNFIKVYVYTTAYGLLWIIALKLDAIETILKGN